jgi:GWxTD domain-containing protein
VAIDATSLYRSAGFLAASGPIAFVGTVVHFASSAADTTLSLLTLSLPTHALTFAREESYYRATYNVHAEFRRAGDLVREVDASEVVRVGSFRETARPDESVVFQQFVRVAPGNYIISVIVRDEGGSRSGSAEATVRVPAIPARGISSILPVYEAGARVALDSMPSVISSPRSTAVFGRDSLLSAYVEVYRPEPGEQLFAAVRSDHGTLLWSDSVAIPTPVQSVGTATVRVPVSPVGIGAVFLSLWRRNGSDTSRAAFFVGFGDELPVASYEDMLNYLRYYTTPQRIRSLRETPPEERATAWASFLRETDPVPSTPQHEGLLAYFGRIQRANDRFRDEGTAGWLTERGMVFVALGEPDRVLESAPGDMNQRLASQIWEYQRFRVQLTFVDRSGFGRWELTTASEQDFQAILRREQIR